jgi:hypothetical protein
MTRNHIIGISGAVAIICAWWLFMPQDARGDFTATCYINGQPIECEDVLK